MPVPSIPVLSSGLSAGSNSILQRKDTPEKIHDAASQFEALLIGQVLKNAHGEDAQGMMGDDEEDSAASTMDFANDFFARSLAAKGGIGLARVISNGLEHASNSSRETPGRSAPVDIPPSG
jgi:Rod binding domain-containing protein